MIDKVYKSFLIKPKSKNNYSQYKENVLQFNYYPMKKVISILIVFFTLVPNKTTSQTQAPGLDVLGYGYDVFGNFADQKSKKRYCLFKYANYSETPIGSYTYKVPQYVILENISNHLVKTVSGESIRDYARSLSSEAGFSGETMFFKGSVNASYSNSITGNEQKFYFTYMDANTKWRVSFDERDLPMLKTILDPRFKQDLETLDPITLFDTYGTHYIASAYLGGRADFNSVSVISSQTKTQDISVAVEASYKAVSGNIKVDTKTAQTLSDAKTTTKLTVTGGNSQYANNINDPETYRLWADGIEKMPVLCDFDKNSLKPIWDFCSNPSRKATLIEAFKSLCAKNPLPTAMANLNAVNNNAYMIKNKATGTFFDFAGYNPTNSKAGDKLFVFGYDNNSIKGQGFDRVYRFETCETEPEYTYIRPQHTNLVLDITGGVINPGTQIQLWDLNKSISQQFKLQPVDGENNTYFIKTKNNLCLEVGQGSTVVSLGTFKSSENQKWKLEDFNPINIAQPAEGYYTIQCHEGGLYWDFPGTYPDIRENKLQLWGPGNAIGDRTMKIVKIGEFFLIRPMHHPNYLLTATNKDSQYSTQSQTRADNQQFSFEYGGYPLAYNIKNKGTGQLITANGDKTSANGCPVTSWNKYGGANQCWKLHGPWKGQTPIYEGQYYIKVAVSDKYWDLGGNDMESNRNGATAQIWDMDGGKDRIVKFIATDKPDCYKIQFQNGGRFLDVSGSWNITSMSLIDQAKYRSGQSDIKLKKDNGAKLQAYENVDNDAQKFRIVYLGENIFAIKSIINEKAVSVSDGKLNENGPNLIMWDFDEHNTSQRFVLINTENNQVYSYE